MSSKYQFVTNHASLYAVTTLCRVLGVSRSGYYAWRARPESQRSQADRTLVRHIQAIHTHSRKTYGSPRIHAELQAQGVRCSVKRVARLMRVAGIRAHRPRRSHTTTDACHVFPVANNVLDRSFAASTPNTKWAADITYISTCEGWLYLAVVMDLFSRRIIGWSMQATLASSLVLVTYSPIFGPSLVREYVQTDKEQAMKASRFSDVQIIAILREAESGKEPIEQLCRRHAIAEATFYRWRSKYGGVDRSDATRLKELERENARLKKLLAERDLELEVMKEANAKKW